MKPRVYIFRGVPVSDKKTIIPEFAKLLPKPVALIEQDKLRWGIHLIGRSVEEVTPDEHKMAHENTVFLYERYLKLGRYTIVVEGLFTWNDEQSEQGSVTKLLELAQENGYDATSIVLAAEKSVLLKRNVERPSHTTPEEEFNRLYESIYGTIGENETVIDSTQDTQEETIAKLARLIT